MKGREVFESNDSLLLNEQKLIKEKDYVETAVSQVQNVPSTGVTLNGFESFLLVTSTRFKTRKVLIG